MEAFNIDELFSLLLKSTELFFVVFARLSGIFIITPIFGRRNIPSYYKIGFTFFITLISVNTLKLGNIEKFNNLFEFTFVTATEFLIGILIGFIAYLGFASIYLAGQLIDMQIGFGIVNVIDPMSNIQIPITSNFYMIVNTLIFLMINGHHMLIIAIIDSFKYIPIGELNFTDKLLKDFVMIFGNIFSMGFRIAAPVTAAIMLTDVALGIMSKTMPQLNIFIVGMPIKILIGITIITITMAMFVTLAKGIMENIHNDIYKIMSDLGIIIWPI
jgi:flagellar biosynthetic protein FliR